MEKNKRKPLLHSQVSGFFVPVKFRMNPRHNKRPGKPKVFTRDEIDRYLEELECGKAQSPREDAEDLSRHCGPNFRRFSDYELSGFMPPILKVKKTEAKRSEDETPHNEAIQRNVEQGEPDDDENRNDLDFDDEDAEGEEVQCQTPAIGMRLLCI